MSRRGKGGAEELVNDIAHLPWWAGVLLAVVACFLLNALSTISGRPVFQAVATAAGLLKFGVPVLFFAGAAVSAWKRHSRRALLASATAGDIRSTVDAMSWRQFELLVGEAYRRRGYAVAETGWGWC